MDCLARACLVLVLGLMGSAWLALLGFQKLCSTVALAAAAMLVLISEYLSG